VIILAYVLGSVKTAALYGSLTAIIQGEHDRAATLRQFGRSFWGLPPRPPAPPAQHD
jgi:hypothetical protein